MLYSHNTQLRSKEPPSKASKTEAKRRKVTIPGLPRRATGPSGPSGPSGSTRGPKVPMLRANRRGLGWNLQIYDPKVWEFRGFYQNFWAFIPTLMDSWGFMKFVFWKIPRFSWV